MWEERSRPLRDEQVIVAAHWQWRPWSGAEVASQTLNLVAHTALEISEERTVVLDQDVERRGRLLRK
jgi:galactose-1-phosphate uridylyltransferase